MIWSVESRYVVPPFSEKVSESRTWWLPLVAALMLQREQSADRVGGSTIGGFLLRRGSYFCVAHESRDVCEEVLLRQRYANLGIKKIKFPPTERL